MLRRIFNIRVFGRLAMAKGRDKHQDYLSELNLLGKTLPDDPVENVNSLRYRAPWSFMILKEARLPEPRSCCLPVSEGIKAMLDGGAIDHDALRCLEHVVWSTVTPVRRVAVQLWSASTCAVAQDAIENARTMNATEI